MNLEGGRRQKSAIAEPRPREAGEARQTGQGGESLTAVDGDERSGGGCLMEQVVARDNMRAALKRVARNKGGAGVDGMTVEDLRIASPRPVLTTTV